MSAYIELDGQRVISGRITLPFYGIWMGDVVLAVPDVIPTSTTLTVGNLKLACTVFRAAAFAGSRSARLVGGAGGWRKDVPRQSYYASNGLRLSTIIRDAGATVGESVAVAQDQTIGNAFVREAGPAARVLRQLAGTEWWIDADGLTRVGTRSGSTINTPFQITAWSGGKGWYEVSTEDIASWLPSNTFSNALVPTTTVGMTEIEVDNTGKLRLGVLSAL